MFTADHFRGIDIGGYAMSGDNCENRNEVAVGLRRTVQTLCPGFGNNVEIGAGTILPGVITFTSSAAMRANVVVIDDVLNRSMVRAVAADIKYHITTNA